MRRSILPILLIVLSTTASAQPVPDDPLRRDLITRAGQARDRGEHVDAINLARLAAARRMTPSLRLFLAQEEEVVGRLVDALRDARACVDELERDVTVARREALQNDCGALVRALSPRVGRLTLRGLDDAPSDTRLLVAGELIPRAAWGSPREVPVGRVVVEASAQGREAFRREVVVDAGAPGELTVPLPEVTVAATRAPEVLVRPVVTSARAADQRPARGPGAGPWVMMGLGVLTLGMVGVFSSFRNGAIDQRDARCASPFGSGVCLVTPENEALANQFQSDAGTYNTLANVSIGLGGAAIAGGLLWFFVGRVSAGSSPRASTTVTVNTLASGAALGLSGAF